MKGTNAVYLYCAPCTDQAIADGETDVDTIPAAVTIVPVMQEFNVGGRPVAAPVSMPVCYSCRRQQLGVVSKAGLVTA